MLRIICWHAGGFVVLNIVHEGYSVYNCKQLMHCGRESNTLIYLKWTRGYMGKSVPSAKSETLRCSWEKHRLIRLIA